jgi:hypothetical protein
MRKHATTNHQHRKSDRINASMLVSILLSTCLPTVRSFAPLDWVSRERVATPNRRHIWTTKTTYPLVSSTWATSANVGKAAPISIPIPSPAYRNDAISPIWDTGKSFNHEKKKSMQHPNQLSTLTDIGTMLSIGATIVPALGVATVANGFELFSASTWTSFQPNSMTDNAISNTINPVVEGEIFSGLAHVALDLLTLTGPATIIVRLGAVVGRILAMAAYYVPDQTVVPEELIFQCLMLCIAWFGLVQSLIPVALSTFAYNVSTNNIISSKKETSKAQRLRDAKAYSLFFKSTGVTWNHFKAMSACAFEWISVVPGDVISTNEFKGKSEEDEFVYWLYNGTVKLQSQGKSLQDIKHFCRQRAANSTESAGCFMLFENRLLKRIVDKDCSNNKKKRGKYTSVRESVKENKSKNDPPMTLVAGGSSNSLLLRINTSNLLMLMETDPQLSNSVRTLLLNSMQAKVNAQMSAGQ